MSLGGRLSGMNEKIRTCTGAPDFEMNKMGGKKRGTRRREKKKKYDRNKSTKVKKSKNNRNDWVTREAFDIRPTLARLSTRFDMESACKDESIHTRTRTELERQSVCVRKRGRVSGLSVKSSVSHDFSQFDGVNIISIT